MAALRLAGLALLSTLWWGAAMTLADGLPQMGGTMPLAAPLLLAPLPQPPPPQQALPPPPALVISNFKAVCEFGTIWSFFGMVEDYDGSTDITIHFSNLPSLNGKSVQVNADGSFLLTVQLAPGEGGTAYAQAVDDQGQMSDEAAYYVVP
jgi:hypothetical protein